MLIVLNIKSAIMLTYTYRLANSHLFYYSLQRHFLRMGDLQFENSLNSFMTEAVIIYDNGLRHERVKCPYDNCLRRERVERKGGRIFFIIKG